MVYDFKGRTVVVTGAGAGIGRAIVQKLVGCGANVVAVSLLKAELDDLVKLIPNVKAIQADVSDWNGVQKALAGLGPIHGLVNNAGIANVAPFLEVTEEQFDKTFGVNVKGIITVSQVVAKNMIANKVEGAAIVNISSIAALKALMDHTAYCGSKAAVDGITRVMALELGKLHDIRVNSINPTVVLTELGIRVWADPVKQQSLLQRIPLGHFAEVDNVVSTILYLLSEESSMVTGVCMRVDGGYGIS